MGRASENVVPQAPKGKTKIQHATEVAKQAATQAATAALLNLPKTKAGLTLQRTSPRQLKRNKNLNPQPKVLSCNSNRRILDWATIVDAEEQAAFVVREMNRRRLSRQNTETHQHNRRITTL